MAMLAAALPYIQAAGTVIGAASAIYSATNKPKLPQPKAAMPMADDETVMQSRRRQAAEMQLRSGRASTILTGSDKLGG